MDKPWRLVAGVSRAAGEVMETLNNDSLAACRGSDVLLYNVPLSISGHTIAEALGIPGIPNAVAPYHPTRAFPSIITPSLPLRGAIPNLVSGAAALEVLWLMFRSHMNRWRKARPGLRKLGFGNPLGRMSKQGIPWLYGFSPSVVPAPTDWPGTAAVCGYWFTPPEKGWKPPARLVDFLGSGPPPVYVGFGSMVGSDPEQTMTIVLEAISKARVQGHLRVGVGRDPARGAARLCLSARERPPRLALSRSAPPPFTTEARGRPRQRFAPGFRPSWSRTSTTSSSGANA